MAHQHEHRDRHHAPPGQIPLREKRRRRLAVLFVALMLVALAIYVLTNDEMLESFGFKQPPAPANP